MARKRPLKDRMLAEVEAKDRWRNKKIPNPAS